MKLNFFTTYVKKNNLSSIRIFIKKEMLMDVFILYKKVRLRYYLINKRYIYIYIFINR